MYLNHVYIACSQSSRAYCSASESRKYPAGAQVEAQAIYGREGGGGQSGGSVLRSLRLLPCRLYSAPTAEARERATACHPCWCRAGREERSRSVCLLVSTATSNVGTHHHRIRTGAVTNGQCRDEQMTSAFRWCAYQRRVLANDVLKGAALCSQQAERPVPKSFSFLLLPFWTFG